MENVSLFVIEGLRREIRVELESLEERIARLRLVEEWLRARALVMEEETRAH